MKQIERTYLKGYYTVKVNTMYECVSGVRPVIALTQQTTLFVLAQRDINERRRERKEIGFVNNYIVYPETPREGNTINNTEIIFLRQYKVPPFFCLL